MSETGGGVLGFPKMVDVALKLNVVTHEDYLVAVGGLSPPETCHVLLHETRARAEPEAGHGAAWRHAARQVGLVRPCTKPDAYELADWRAISPALCTVL